MSQRWAQPKIASKALQYLMLWQAKRGNSVESITISHKWQSKRGSNVESITISHDMTIKEREQCRELVEQVKKKRKKRRRKGWDGKLYLPSERPSWTNENSAIPQRQDCCEKSVVKDKDDDLTMYNTCWQFGKQSGRSKIISGSLECQTQYHSYNWRNNKHTNITLNYRNLTYIITLSVIIWIQNTPHEELLFISIINWS